MRTKVATGTFAERLPQKRKKYLKEGARIKEKTIQADQKYIDWKLELDYGNFKIPLLNHTSIYDTKLFKLI